MSPPAATLLTPLFAASPDLATAEVSPADVDLAALHPLEATIVAHAVLRRQREFAAGRWCAHRALAELGTPAAAPILAHERMPLWPDGVTGSIAHKADYAAAVVARQSAPLVAVGLDVEGAGPLADNLWPTILTEAEGRWLELVVPAADRGRVAKLIFSAKECVFKCQYPLSRRWLEFHDVVIEPDLGGAGFRAIVLGEAAGLGLPGLTASARYRFAGDWVLTGITLSRS